MTQQNSQPRLHMGCGEALHSQWLPCPVRPEHKSPSSLVCTSEQTKRKRKQGPARG
ncbi:MAG TPA: hypothetical protein VN448_00340 [Gammaproteobacteria bacterium]|jgi:hypothetical protein|nr:hypothetical protein [Gammaproteobacteria bacterium]